MFNKRKKEYSNQEKVFYSNLISELERVYEVNKNYTPPNNAYLEGDSEIEIMLNKIIELKSSHIREQFLQNGDIKDIIKALREEIGTSEQVMSEAANVFSKGTEYINEAANSMDKVSGVLNNIDSTFENIAANVEEQSATTQEITARLSEVNGQTKILKDVCMRTGQSIYDVSAIILYKQSK